MISSFIRRIYHTLGLIYEDIGDKKKSLDFYMIAAHVTPKDALLWKRLAHMSRYIIYSYASMFLIDL